MKVERLMLVASIALIALGAWLLYDSANSFDSRCSTRYIPGSHCNL